MRLSLVDKYFFKIIKSGHFNPKDICKRHFNPATRKWDEGDLNPKQIQELRNLAATYHISIPGLYKTPTEDQLRHPFPTDLEIIENFSKTYDPDYQPQKRTSIEDLKKVPETPSTYDEAIALLKSMPFPKDPEWSPEESAQLPIIIDRVDISPTATQIHSLEKQEFVMTQLAKMPILIDQYLEEKRKGRQARKKAFPY